MPSLAIERLESALQARHFDHTLTSHRRLVEGLVRVAPTGWDRLDAALGGGWTRGELSEIVGPRSSGRTWLALTTLAAATRRGEVVALVDAVDRLDPVSAKAAGVDLTRLLWIRGPAVTAEQARPTLLDDAVSKAVRAFDLVLRAGGFALVVLDLADLAPRVIRALPPATWMRLARVMDGATGTAGRDTAGLILGDAPISRSAGGVSVRLAATGVWTGPSIQQRRLTRLALRADIVSARHIRGGMQVSA
jgi:RecA/RadA recombinase